MGIVPGNEHTLGGEGAGIVTRVSPGATGSFEVGQRVVVFATCRSGVRLRGGGGGGSSRHLPDDLSWLGAVRAPLGIQSMLPRPPSSWGGLGSACGGSLAHQAGKGLPGEAVSDGVQGHSEGRPVPRHPLSCPSQSVSGSVKDGAAAGGNADPHEHHDDEAARDVRLVQSPPTQSPSRGGGGARAS